jgi:ribosome-binding ATPase
MKLAITGLELAGKTTIFESLTGSLSDVSNKNKTKIETVSVPDKRIDELSLMYEPKKTIYAQIQYFLPTKIEGANEKNKEDNILFQIRDCDGIINVVRNFNIYGLKEPSPYNDYLAFNRELMFADFMTVEKRLERINADKKRGKKINDKELLLLEECKFFLEKEIPIRENKELAESHELRGFALLSGKPLLILFNNEDEDEDMPEFEPEFKPNEKVMMLRGRLENEIMQMPKNDAKEFLEEFNITALAKDRAIKNSYDLLGLISFFTVGKDEVRAWTIKKKTSALDAAEVIHSDIKKGFIRAEVVHYDDLMELGSHNEAKKQGKVRLEGKKYEVKDGDIINFRFNV